MAQVIVIGGGLSGLINSILLARAGFKVILFEKNKYPFHRVCGEYISNEVVPFLKENALYPDQFNLSRITNLEITTITGEVLQKQLDLGGFGISRYVFDAYLAEHARNVGVNVVENATVKEVLKKGSKFHVQTPSISYVADFVIGAQGKRSTLDRKLSRSFLKKRSPYVGVKYHVRGPLKPEVISLHNFDGGYCGINQIEDGKFNICYLVHRDQVRKYGNLQKCEQDLLHKNPYLREVFKTSELLFKDPLVINEVSFSVKGLSKNGVVFSGDAAGAIAPFSGNGMAMAIRSAKYLSESIIRNWSRIGPDHEKIYMEYQKLWNAEFAARISRGQKIQKLFGNPQVSRWSVKSGKVLPFLVDPILKMTHGQPFS